MASKENFSKVLLKKTEGTVSTPGGSSAGCDPYKDVMLLHVKGITLPSSVFIFYSDIAIVIKNTKGKSSLEVGGGGSQRLDAVDSLIR